MKDKIITTKTAKLAAKHNYKDSVNEGWFYYSKQYKSEYWTNTKGGISGVEDCYKKPTQSLLQKWLREKHDIHVEIKKNVDGYSFIVYPKYELNGDFWLNYIQEMSDPELRRKHLFSTYEKALEIGLQEALKML